MKETDCTALKEAVKRLKRQKHHARGKNYRKDPTAYVQNHLKVEDKDA